jgi:hypothetical protein
VPIYYTGTTEEDALAFKNKKFIKEYHSVLNKLRNFALTHLQEEYKAEKLEREKKNQNIEEITAAYIKRKKAIRKTVQTYATRLFGQQDTRPEGWKLGLHFSLKSRYEAVLSFLQQSLVEINNATTEDDNRQLKKD